MAGFPIILRKERELKSDGVGKRKISPAVLMSDCSPVHHVNGSVPLSFVKRRTLVSSRHLLSGIHFACFELIPAQSVETKNRSLVYRTPFSLLTIFSTMTRERIGNEYKENQEILVFSQHNLKIIGKA